MTKIQLTAALEKAVRFPHKHVHKGRLIVSPRAYETPGLETNLAISPFSILDCTGSIRIGPWCNIGPRVRVYTHDTFRARKMNRVLRVGLVLFRQLFWRLTVRANDNGLGPL